MTQSDQQKVLNQGFTIIRPDFFRMSIKQKVKNGREWKTLEKGFASKAALERRMKELLEMNLIIQD